MTTITVTLELPLEEAQAIAGDPYANAESIFAITRARAKVARAARIALAIGRVETAVAEFKQAQEAS